VKTEQGRAASARSCRSVPDESCDKITLHTNQFTNCV